MAGKGKRKRESEKSDPVDTPSVSPFVPGGGGPAPGGESQGQNGVDLSESREEEIELLTFQLANEIYAVDIHAVEEITKSTQITPVPRTFPCLKGIITLRGNVIPVFDMHVRLGLPPFVEGVKNRFIICKTENGRAAMWVDRVDGVVRLSTRSLEAPPSGIAADKAERIKQTARHSDRLLILLDVDRSLRID
ncbi:MAG: chemotaxis protein CheW [Candidatus Manganitrophaceae bacterium]